MRIARGVVINEHPIADAKLPEPLCAPKRLILPPAIDLVADSIEHPYAIGTSFFPSVQHCLSSGLHPFRSDGVVV
jgi:hypothetical protein